VNIHAGSDRPLLDTLSRNESIRRKMVARVRYLGVNSIAFKQRQYAGA